MTTLARVTSIKLQDFRGWGRDGDQPRIVNTDADLVLLSGANGFGKSSLLEALVLLLTNYRVHQPPTGDTPKSWAELAHAGASRWELSLEGVESDTHPSEAPLTARASWSVDDPPIPDNNLPRSDPWYAALSATGRDGQVESELLSAALSFFQEDPRANLDDGGRSSPLRDWLKPVTPAIKALRELLPDLVSRAHGRIRENDEKREQLRQLPEGLLEQSRALATTLASFLQGLDLPHAAELAAAFPPDEAPDRDGLQRLLTLIRDAARERGRAARPGSAERDPLGLAQLLDACERLADSQDLSTAELERELADIRRRLATLPTPEEAEATFAWAEDRAPDGVPGVSLPELLGSLARNHLRWLEQGAALADPRLAPLLDELARLDLGTVQALARASAAIITRLTAGAAERNALEARTSAIEAELQRERARVPETLRAAVAALRAPWEKYQENRTALESLPDTAALQEVADGYEALQAQLEDGLRDDPTQAFETLLAQVLDRTLIRFQPREGMLPVRSVIQSRGREGQETRYDVLTTADGRPWTDASTGQKAQLSLAWMLAHTLALKVYLPARVLVLDDTSTAFDLGNLARQATWLRQLAYHPDPAQRWQIFLASHHDELTSRLVELLRPPEGRTLRVVEFVGWQRGRGPDFKSWDLRLMSPRLGGDAPARLQEALKLVWADGLAPGGTP